jgi:hypothetical protein
MTGLINVFCTIAPRREVMIIAKGRERSGSTPQRVKRK